MKHTFCMALITSSLLTGCYADIRVPAKGLPKEEDGKKSPKKKSGKRGSGEGEKTANDHTPEPPRAELGVTPTTRTNDIAIIEVSNFRFNGGRVCFSIYDTEAGFPNNADVAVVASCKDMIYCGENCNGVKLQIEVPELDYGRDYAVALFHDVDGDGDLGTTGPLKIPNEDFGFSNNPDVFSKFGAPDYDECVISWNEKAPVAQIKLQNIL